MPSSKPVIALSATGRSTNSVCQSLDFKDPFFHLLRSSYERPNTQSILKRLSHGVSGEVFPQLLSYLSTGQSLDTMYRVYTYLMRFLRSTIVSESFTESAS